MPRKLKPKTRYELYKKILLMWYTAESENIKAFTFSKSDKYKQRQQLKERYNEYLKMWDDFRI